MLWLLVLCAIASVWAQSHPPAPAPASGSRGTPFARGEVLNYSVNWPSGLGLGEAQFRAGGGEPGWQFEFTLDAGLPGFDIRERHRSKANGQFCSETLEKESTRGTRKTRETVTYDAQKRVALRQTLGGGKSEVSTGDCVKDALTFVYYLRRELSGGRLPPSQTVNFGAPYQVTASYADSAQLEVGGTRQTADRVMVSFRGPASDRTFEIFFARDAARTPLVLRVPFSLGTFALELVR